MHTPIRILACLTCLAAFPASAQPTLHATTFTAIAGELYNYTKTSYQTVASGTGGSNVTWDFSSLSNNGFEQVKFLNPSAGTYGASYPTAAMLRKGTQEAYYNMPTGSVEQIGTVFGGGVMTSCANSQRTMQFPFSYNESFVDTFRCTYISGVVGTRTGVDSVWADGWGTLILPGETFTDVLRVRLKSRYNDTIDGQPVVNYVDDRTFFYKPGIHASLLSMVDAAAFSNGGLLALKQETVYCDVPTGIANLEGVQEALRISPVPASNTLNIDMEHAHERRIRIELWNSTGQVVRQGWLEAGSLHASLDCTTLARGVYFVRCADGASNVAKQVVLQ